MYLPTYSIFITASSTHTLLGVCFQVVSQAEGIVCRAMPACVILCAFQVLLVLYFSCFLFTPWDVITDQPVNTNSRQSTETHIYAHLIHCQPPTQTSTLRLPLILLPRTVEITALLAVLSPAIPRIPLSHFPGSKIWAGLLVESVVLPVAVLHTMCSSWVQWGGVWYCKSQGQIVRVLRPGS